MIYLVTNPYYLIMILVHHCPGAVTLPLPAATPQKPPLPRTAPHRPGAVPGTTAPVPHTPVGGGAVGQSPRGHSPTPRRPLRKAAEIDAVFLSRA